MSEETAKERRKAGGDSRSWFAISRTRLLSEALSPRLQRFIVHCALRCDCDGAVLALLREDAVIIRAGYRITTGRVPRQDSALAFAAEAESAIVVTDARGHQTLAGCSEVRGEPGMRFFASVAFAVDDSGPVGTLSVFSSGLRRDEFSPELLEEFRDVLQHMLYRRDDEELDQDTGLLGPMAFSRVFAEEYRAAERGRQQLILLVLSLPGLGRLNEALGASAGDRVVATLSELVHRRIMVEGVQAGRLTGSSVAVLLPRRVSAAFLQSTVATVRAGLMLGRHHVPMSAAAFELEPAALPELDLELLLMAAERATAGRVAARVDPLPHFKPGQLREFRNVNAPAEDADAGQEPASPDDDPQADEPPGNDGRGAGEDASTT